MELDPELLRELHRILKQVTDLTERIARGPKQLLACQSNLKKADEELVAAKEKQKKTRMLADEKQLLMKQREDRIAKLQGDLNTAGSNKQFQLLKDQIAAEQQANDVLADEIFELLERVDSEGELVAAAEKVVSEAKEQLKSVDDRVAAERVTLESELERVNAMRADAESRMPDGFRDNYKRLVGVKGAESMAEVDDECCGGCYQTLNAQIFNNLHLGKTVFCKSCGCVLYLPEGYKVK